MPINYVIDTNVMIHDPKFMYRLQGDQIIIPILAIEELDGLKKRSGIVGYHARLVAKELHNLMKRGDLSQGVTLPHGGVIRIEMNHMDTVLIPNGMDLREVDAKILAVTMSIQKTFKDSTTILITKDLYMTIKANGLGIRVQDYPFDKIEIEHFYKGYSQITMASEEMNKLYKDGSIPLPPLEEQVYPNHFFHITSNNQQNHSILCRYDGNKLVPLKYINDTAWGLRPINREQRMAFELLMDPNIHFLTITGGAGSGKTILSTAVALQSVIETRKYRKIVFVRPVVAAGNDIGFLPGEEKEKLKPWMGSFYDAIENLSDFRYGHEENDEKPNYTVDDFIEQFRQRGMIETKTFTYMRGRTFTNSLIIVDEAQEMTPHLAKLMLTRAGLNSKFVFIGDPSDNQIDNAFVDSSSNGLVYTVEKMKAHHITGHVTLNHVERSELAKIAEKSM